MDEVVRGLHALIDKLGDHELPRLPPRVQASAAALPEGRIGGTRATAQHRRRIRAATPMPSAPTARMPREVAESLFVVR